MRRGFFSFAHSAQTIGSCVSYLFIFSFLTLGYISFSGIAHAKTVEKTGAPDLPNVYGIVAVYDLGFNDPRTRSGHTVWVGNREQFDIIYTYEFQHGIQGFNDPDYEDKKLIEGRQLDEDGGDNDWFRDDDYRGLNVNNLPLLIPGITYTIDAYTRFEAHKKGVRRLSHSWFVKDTLDFAFMR